jgi:hypothetical protein
MGHFRRVIAGVLVEMLEATDTTFTILGDGLHVVVLTHTADDGHGHGRWLCPCGHDSGHRDPMLSNVVAKHATLSPLTCANNGRTLEAVVTSLRLAGHHADPTYNEAMRNMYGFSW